MSSKQRQCITPSRPRLGASLIALVLVAAAGASAANAQTPPVVTINEVTPTTNCEIASCSALNVKWSVQAAPEIVIQRQQLLAEVGLRNGATQPATPLTVDGAAREARLLLAAPPADTVTTFKVKIVTTFAQPTVTSVEKTGTLPPVLVPVDRELTTGLTGGRRTQDSPAARAPTQGSRRSPRPPQP